MAPNAQPFVALILGTALLAWLGVPATVRAQEDVEVDRPRPLVEQSWPETREARAGLPPFLRDTALTVRLRTNYVEAQTITRMQREGLVSGGWLAYRSGWLLNDRASKRRSAPSVTKTPALVVRLLVAIKTMWQTCTSLFPRIPGL
jgi:hypothetical protein